MSMNNIPVVMIGKLITHETFPDELIFEDFLGERYEPFVYRFDDEKGSGCIGLILGECSYYRDDDYGERVTTILNDVEQFNTLITNTMIFLNEIGIVTDRKDVKIYLMDDWT